MRSERKGEKGGTLCRREQGSKEKVMSERKWEKRECGVRGNSGKKGT